MKYTILLASLFLFAIFSCDKVEPPYTTQTQTPVDTGTTKIYVQKVMVEDFTGHKCGTCPAAHRVLDDLVGVYGDKLVPMAIHAGWFAQVTTDYPEDFQTTEGTTIFDDFNIQNTPYGMVNRTPYNSELVLTKDKWGAAIQNILDSTELRIGIDIENTYNSTSNNLDCKIKVTFLKTLSDTLSLAIYFIEDSIISKQTDYEATPSDVDDYLHKHVLRGSINGTYGEQIIAGTAIKDASVDRQYTFALDTAKYNLNHCYTVAFVFNTNNKEILNVEEAKFIE